ncbi:hypothetical protein F5B20DRAFT_539294 [Whalleya microplaca]|nr:hypothetical protein F5B20DRAFT_539294 [Whalleya microplaca]
MATQDEQCVKGSFNWLRREDRGPAYISYSQFSNRSACSFELGDNGYAASCNYGGELLQMSAKDKQNGIILAHGDFEPSYYSSLARAQRKHGEQASFGLNIATNQQPYAREERITDIKKRGSSEGSSLRLGNMTERGCFNYRWPFNEYVLLLNEVNKSEAKETGTCARISFVKDDILYQVIRLEPGCRPEADQSHQFPWRGQIVLTIGGKINYRIFNELQDEGLDGLLDARVHQLNNNKYEKLNVGECNFSKEACHMRIELPKIEKEVRLSDRHVTFIAGFRLKTAGTQRPWPDISTSEDLYEYLGINPDNQMATGPMWEAIYLQREEQTNCFSELPEANLVGRCIEKILTVDLIPAAFGKKGNSKFEDRGPLALVSNLFLHPSIDVQSMFFKIRFLVEAHQFLSLFENKISTKIEAPAEEEVENEVENMNKIVSFQIQRLQDCIERAILFLAKAFIQPDTETCFLSFGSMNFHPRYYYVMMTIWYAVNKCDEFNWAWVDEMKQWPIEKGLLVETLIPPDNLRLEEEEMVKVSFLKWYHYVSVLNLLKTKKGSLIPAFWQSKVNRSKVNHLARYARQIAAAKLLSRQLYSAKHEIIDRLGFLAKSLDIEDPKNHARSAALITTRRILDRDFTRCLNPGRLSTCSKGPTCGPWEIHALCHHSRLIAENYQYELQSGKPRELQAEAVEKCQNRISQFLNAEACLVPCWERTNAVSFQSEATSVLASTLLDVCQKDLASDLKGTETAASGKHWSPSPTPTSTLIPPPISVINPISLGPISRMRDFTNESSNNRGPLRERVLVKAENIQRAKVIRLPAIEWIRYRPPHQHHHANFFNSLEDTPEIFKNFQIDECTTKLLSLLPGDPSRDCLQSFLEEKNMEQALKPYRLAIIDLKASMPKQWNIHAWQGYTSESSKYEGDGRDDVSNKTKILKNQVKKLSDSLLDQQIQHRTIILSTSKFDRCLLSLFSHVFHRGSTDCLINHLSKFPDFSCQKGDTWTTRITLRSWSKSAVNPLELQQNGIHSDGSGDLSSNEDSAIMLPNSLRTPLQFINKRAFESEEKSPGIVQLKVSSIILSTYGFGDFSRCAIISELFNGKQDEVNRKCKELWERFIHQPQTGRCLVFLTILGLLCQKIAAEYQVAMEYFILTLKLDKSFLFDEANLLGGKYSLKQLQLGLWSLESLLKLQNNLSTSMRCIKEASTEMRAQILHGPGKRGETLEMMCQESLEDFERKLGQLIVFEAELNRKIELNSRFKDSLSNVLSLQDSRNSIRQNSTIQRLTYFTIGYLPVGLATAIFAIPSDQRVLIPAMGIAGYVVCIVCLFILTFTLAIYMEQIQHTFSKLQEIWPLSGGEGPVPSDNANTPPPNGDDEDSQGFSRSTTRVHNDSSIRAKLTKLRITRSDSHKSWSTSTDPEQGRM